MPASLIATAVFDLEATSFAYAATTFAIRLATTMAIASLLQPGQQPTVGAGTPGGEIQLNPATDNKLPVIYGSTYVQPIITDVILASDQQSIYYVLTFGEATDGGDINFDEVWFDGKLLMFDPTNPHEIVGWWTRPKKNSKNGGSIETGPAGKVSMWFYKNGSLITGTTHRTFGLPGDTYGTGDSYQDGGLKSTDIDAITLLSNGVYSGEIPAETQWISTDKMLNTTFAVLRLQYDQNNGVHGLGQIQAKINNTLNQPGSVIKDYMSNARYGCGIDPAHIDPAMEAKINALSSPALEITDTDGNQVSNTFTYQINGIIDTTKDCLTNLSDMAQACDSWIQWDERNGYWSVVPNRSVEESGLTTSTMTVITADQIIGGVNLTPTDLKSSPNKISISFPNDYIIGQQDYRYYWLDSDLKSPNEPENNIDINYQLVNNSVQATYLGYRKLWMGRQDLVINFTMDYSGIHINAGDVVVINHEWYGWTLGYDDNGNLWNGKPFRVTQVKEAKDSSGFLSVQITAMSYHDKMYYTMNPHYYTPDEFGLLTATNFISQPIAPSVYYVNSSTGVFQVKAPIPDTGNVTGMEFWYSQTTSTFSSNNYTLYTTQYYGNGGSLYPHKSDNGDIFYEQAQVVSFPTNTYWWVSRAQGPNSTSVFSPSSQPFAWSNTQTVVLGSQVLDGSIGGSKVIPPASNTTPSQSKGFFDSMGPILGASLAATAGYYAYKNGLLDSLLPKDYQSQGGGNDAGTKGLNPTTNIQYYDKNGTKTDSPQPGGEALITADATPPQDPPYQVAQNEDNGLGGSFDFGGYSDGSDYG